MVYIYRHHQNCLDYKYIYRYVCTYVRYNEYLIYTF